MGIRRWRLLTCVLVLISLSGFVTAAGADNTVTYTATQTIPVPPASNFAGTGGGDGWAVAMTPTSVFNVFHHSSILTVACHLQSDASPCWTGNLGPTRRIREIDNANERTSDFAVSGQPGLFLDQPTGHLYLYGTRNSDRTGGVVCVDTVAAPTDSNPFCGFTPLTAAQESQISTNSYLSNGALVGNRFFAFNFVNGSGVSGAKNMMLCFDITTFAACAGQPFSVDIGDNTVSAGDFPSPSVVAIGNQVIVPVNAGGAKLGCLDGVTLAKCSGSWPVSLDFGYPSSSGAAFPLLNSDGGILGLCLPSTGAPCYSLAGASVATPAGLASAMGGANDGWNGPAFVLGPRVYVPNGNTNQVHCYDYNLSSSCANFPKSFNSLGYLYTVNSDPQRPACIWVNADNGSQQIQNFDAFTGGACGAGAIRVLASSSVVTTPLCTPGSWKSLQVTSPQRSNYSSGSVAFQDASGTSIPGASDVPLDANGIADLSGLDLSKGSGLPQFLITLAGSQGTGSVGVTLTWTGVSDPSCTAKLGPGGGGGSVKTTIPPKADVTVTMASPLERRTNDSVTFTATVHNDGPDTATGVVLRTPIPTGAKLISVTASRGNGCTTFATVANCYIGTLTNGQSATVTLVFSSPNATTLNVTSSSESDYDPNHGNNIASATTAVLDPGTVPPAPPKSGAPGTFNAIGTGTILINGVPVSADQIFTLKSGDIVDVTNGIITFTDSEGKYGSWASTRLVAQRRTAGSAALTLVASAKADNLQSRFQVQQDATAGSITNLSLVGSDYASCTSPRSLAADTKPVQQLWGSAKGTFRTNGRFSAATVRGTIWMIQDRCDGTLTQVVEGVVDVFDIGLSKTVSVGPGQSYLALAPVKQAPFTPPASLRRQTAAQVLRRGLLYGTQVFKTRKAFETFLTGKGQKWSDFAKGYPKLAAALVKRSNKK